MQMLHVPTPTVHFIVRASTVTMETESRVQVGELLTFENDLAIYFIKPD